jgi:hypothetical protein
LHVPSETWKISSGIAVLTTNGPQAAVPTKGVGVGEDRERIDQESDALHSALREEDVAAHKLEQDPAQETLEEEDVEGHALRHQVREQFRSE